MLLHGAAHLLPTQTRFEVMDGPGLAGHVLATNPSVACLDVAFHLGPPVLQAMEFGIAPILFLLQRAKSYATEELLGGPRPTFSQEHELLYLAQTAGYG